MKISRYIYHLLAIAVIIVWGSTFVSTKVLINQGMHPDEIFFYRFVIAYAGIWFCGKQKLWAENITDEILLALAGIMGGSLYFVGENRALEIAQASDVSFIVSTTPLLTAWGAFIFLRKKQNTLFYISSLLALAGVAMIVYNGSYSMDINPVGYALALIAAVGWAVYSIAVKKVENRYSNVFITRKIFFYGVITILPLLWINRHEMSSPASLIENTAIVGNVLFLGVLASLICFILWNIVLRHLGVVASTNYLFLNPVVTLVASFIFLDEKITSMSIIGSIAVLAGVIIATKNSTD